LVSRLDNVFGNAKLGITLIPLWVIYGLGALMFIGAGCYYMRGISRLGQWWTFGWRFCLCLLVRNDES